MKLLLLADNSDQLNWGCRGTSYALRQILSRHHEIVGQIHRDVLTVPLSAPRYISEGQYGRLVRRTKRMGGVKGALGGVVRKALGTHVELGHDVDCNVHQLLQLADRSRRVGRILADIDAADAVVVNGEGEMIFANPPRYSLLSTLTIARLAQLRGKPVFWINGMVSACPLSGLNLETVAMAREVLSGCQVAVRDPISHRFLAEIMPGIPAEFYPDALFSWTDGRAFSASAASAAENLRALLDRSGIAVPFALATPFIALSGSSAAAKFPDRARASYGHLLERLRSLGLPVVVMPTCDGDRFLADVARDLGAPLVPTGVPLVAGAEILARASLLVSGRWHPAILAADGGTPNILMGSNSHKTASLLEMLPLAQEHEFGFLPDRADVEAIVGLAARELEQGAARREATLARARELSGLAQGLADFVR